MITAVDLLRGLAALIGWRRIDVPGATGYLDTDYAAKGRYAVEASNDVRPGLRSRRGDRRGLARRQCGRPRSRPWNRSTGTSSVRCYAALKKHGEYRILVSPDHPTPLRTKTHSHGNVPFAMAGSGMKPDAATVYDDPTAERSSLVFAEGWRLMGYFLGTA